MLSNPLTNFGEEQRSQRRLSVITEGNVLFHVIHGKTNLVTSNLKWLTA